MVNTSHNNRLNHIEEWSQCTWDAVKAPYLGSIPVVPCGWCSATEQLARNSRYGKQQPKFPLVVLRFYTHTHTTFKKCLLPEAKAIDFSFLFCFSFPFFSHSHYENFEYNIRRRRRRHSRLFPVATTNMFSFSFFSLEKKKSKRIKQLFILLLLLRREMPNLQTFF
jgi:hypothetical protein